MIGPLAKPNFVTSIAEARAAKKRGRVILGGDLVTSALEDVDLGEHYVAQPERHLRTGLPFAQAGQGLRVWVAKKALNAFRKKPGSVSLALDAWLAWGRKQSGSNVIIFGGGLEAPDAKTIIDILLFEAGSLKRIRQVAIEPKNSKTYLDELNDLIQTETENAGWDKSVQVSTFLDPNRALDVGATYIPESHIKFPRISRVDFGFQRLFFGDVAIPLSLVLASTAFGAFNVYQERDRLYELRDTFRTQSAPVQQEYAAGEGALKLLQAKQGLLESNSPVLDTIIDLEHLLNAVVEIGDLTVGGIALANANADSNPFDGLVEGVNGQIDNSADYFLQVYAISKPSMSPLEQAEPVLNALSQAAGGWVNLNSVTTESPREDFELRGFNVEGVFPE